MKSKLYALAGLAGLIIGSPALAETCKVQVTGPAGQWKFLHVYDLATGEVVLSQAVKSGDSEEVDVKGGQIRIEWKLAGYTKYRPGPVAPCKGGNIVKI